MSIIKNYRECLFRNAQRYHAIDATGNIPFEIAQTINKELQRDGIPKSIDNRFVWDFTPIVKNQQLIGFSFLNAELHLAKTEQHHFHSQVGFAQTKDFVDINWIDSSIFKADKNKWDNTSIWSNDIIWYNNQWMLFYTSRDKNIDDGFTQSIGLAVSDDLIEWRRIPDFQLEADPRWYLTHSIKDDPTFHAWRDPYFFQYKNCFYMLLSAKDKKKPIGRNGCIALLKAKNNDLMQWDVLPPLTSPGKFSEMEEAEILISESGEVIITFSSWAKYDYATQKGGLLYASLGAEIELGSDLKNKEVQEINCLLPESSKIYAAHAIPEIGGSEIIGFNIEKGGLQRSGVFTSLKRFGRNF